MYSAKHLHCPLLQGKEGQNARATTYVQHFLAPKIDSLKEFSRYLSIMFQS